MPVTDTAVGSNGTSREPVIPGPVDQRLDLRFGKQQRLLTPKDFKAVFDGAVFKASHRHLLLLAIPAAAPPARLGLVVAKKHAKLAVQRNRLKRLLRESFRQHQYQLAGLDIVALVKPGLWQQDNPAIRSLVEEQWQRLLKQQRQQRPVMVEAEGS